MIQGSPLPPTIELREVRLRPLRMADGAPFFDYLRDPVVTELTSYPDVTLELVESMIEKSVRRWAAGEPAKWGIARRFDDQLIGTCGFNEWTTLHRRAELAYELARDSWGKGIMQQAVSAVLAWAYGQDQIDRVQAFVRIDNSRSARLLERSGFSREGCLRSFRVGRGQAHDFYVYGLLRSEWQVIQRAGEEKRPDR